MNLSDIDYGRFTLIDVASNKPCTCSPPLLKTDEVEILVDLSIDRDNCWNANEELKIFRLKDTGWYGIYHLVPCGYSTYTYDPEISNNIYNTTDLDWFYRYALSQE